MTFWVQHGYGKGDKIARLMDADLVAGVVLSPCDEDDAGLAATAAAIQDSGARGLVDPQLYVYSIQGAQARCHESHGIDFGEISWFVSPSDISDHVAAIIEMNGRLGTEEIIAPAPYLTSFNDVWAPISLQYARSCVEASDGPVFVSVIAEDAAFSDWEATARWLDAVTTIDSAGIYLVVGHAGRTYPMTWECDRLANTLRVIYALAELNEYELIWGYADIAGLAGLAAGASGVASGWYHSLRMWTPQKWVPQRGGRQANPRVLLPPLLSPLEAVGEAISVAGTAPGPRAFPSEALLQRFRQPDPAWGLTDAWYQHMESVAQTTLLMDSDESIPEKVEFVHGLCGDAESLLAELIDAGAALDAGHASRVSAIREALELFAEAEDL